MRVRRGVGDIPAGPTTINILTGQPVAPGTTFSPGAVPAVAPGGTGGGASGYTINPDGSVTWYDALGNAISNVPGYNAAVSPGDTGPAALGLPSAASALASLPSWALPAGIGLLLVVFLLPAGRGRR